MARGEQLLRQWRLLNTLQRRGIGLTLQDLVDELDVSERTVQRDLHLLREAGFPLEYQEDDFARRHWSLPNNFIASGALTLSLTEALTLHLADQFFAPLDGTHLADALRILLDKLRSQLPHAALEHFRDLDGIVYVRRTAVTDFHPHAETIKALIDAARAEQTVNIDYFAMWSDREYATPFDPYGLVLFEGDLFALGYSHRAGDIRSFKVTRIRELTPTAARFARPETFDLAARFRNSFGVVQSTNPAIDVVVRFDGPAAALVEERTWHPTQRLEWLPAEPSLFERDAQRPESLIAHFRLNDLREFQRWLLGFGPDAEVLQPAAFRSAIGAALRTAARRYARPDQTP